ncbi:glycosyltransferase family 1 [Oceanobacillus oncorhynchi subsp. incaldanensis]|uniref:glycosyltransferase n=1 Tax=Oceanobacillus oncorhynchi TaxID=545501 RepID=UPI001B2374D5|nr:glycosyltransferase [Oceanobacillus oncorhynchi]GIO19643.1 glycosyltransferase family 1 [Oceanobacillus oncorhynchi subsp. incaldanensis]
MIKVLHFGLDSKLGGIETYLHKLYTEIDREQFQFDFLVVGDKEPCWYEEFTSMGSEFFHVTPRNQNPIKNKKQIERILEENHFDVVHCHLNTLSYITPVSVSIKKNVPVIVHSRNAGASKSLITNILHKMNSKFLAKGRIEKIAVSGLAGEWLFGEKEKFTIFNNGLDIEKYSYNENARKKIRNELELNEDFVVMHLGAMRPQKNHMFILDIFQEIVQIKENAKLLLVGDGVLKEEIVQKINYFNLTDKVLIVGNRNDVSDLLSASDSFLFPSVFEGFPNAVLEAETSGLPCLISEEITNEVVINNNCLSFSLDKTAKEWAEKLISLPSFEDRKSGAKNIETNGFSVKDEIKKIENLYVNLSRK